MSLSRTAFFRTVASQGLALTYDDVRLDTAISTVTAQQTDITSRFSRTIGLRAPIISAAMDTVTTSAMAIQMAKLGGLGVVHAGLSVEAQKQEVRKVKLELNGRIDNPVTVQLTDTLEDIIAYCNEKDFNFHTFPVVDSAGILKGLLTQTEFDLNPNRKVTAQSIMTPQHELITAGPRTSVEQAYKHMQKHKKKTIPLVDSKGKVAGMYVLSDVRRLINGNPKEYNLDPNGRLRVAAAVPTDEGALTRIEAMSKYLDVAVIDTAQGDSQFAFQTLRAIKKRFPKLDVVVGNVSSARSARALAEAGADGIKVGQGPGSICTTRIETGIGCPQVTAVNECSQAVKSFGIPICADGGITNPGDISIAIAAGASSVMMGGKLAGTKESPGKIITTEDNKMVKLYRGMGSPSAMRDSEASRKRYGVEGSKGTPLSEGVESYVTYKGPVSDVVDHYIKALRKSMSYVGSKDIKTHQTKTRFIRITNAGYRESAPHDVQVI